MGFFDGWAGRYFRKDAAGRTVYYPWGSAGRGYILPDGSREARIRASLKLEQKVTLVLFLAAGAFMHWLPVVCAMAGVYAWSYLMNGRLVRGLEISDERLTLKQSLTGQAHATGPRTLRIFFVFWVLAAVVAVAIPVFKRETTIEDIIIACVLVIFFGLSALATGYMIKVKR